ncbi:NAD(P)-dependent oxidoreductase [Maribacter arcticus]|uniref:NAD-dependent epimerase/dehydratase family protein n=1 Tax=Maribacter arcticus TaxID=561365 RepID=UPI003002D090
MNILITGINGFLGSYVYKHFKNGNVIKGIARSSNKLGDVEIYSSDQLLKINFVPDVVIMCHAAVSSGNDSVLNNQLYDSNVAFTKSVSDKFKSSKLIYLSTVSIYDNTQLIKENSKINPKSEYAISKLWGENIILNYEKAIVLRISSMYGNGMKENTIIPNYINQALSNSVIEVWGNGSRKQNYIHVSDVVKYLEAIIENFESNNKTIFLGVSKTEHSNFELSKIISNHTKAKVEFVNEDYSTSYMYNNNFTTETLGFEPQVSFNEAIINYIECQKKQY